MPASPLGEFAIHATRGRSTGAVACIEYIRREFETNRTVRPAAYQGHVECDEREVERERPYLIYFSDRLSSFHIFFCLVKRKKTGGIVESDAQNSHTV